MNAHISFDLGMALVDVKGENLSQSVREDFNKINLILAQMIDSIQSKIRQVSPLIGLLDILSRFDEALTAFSIKIARDAAWGFAVGISEQSPDNLEAFIQARDQSVATFGQQLLQLQGLVRLGVRLINLTERKNIPYIVDTLR